MLLAFAAAPLAVCGRKSPQYAAIPAGSTVLALGDSLTFGTGAAAEAAYRGRLAELTGWSLVNGGVPGNTSAQARERLAALLAEPAPRGVLVSIGGNDFLRQLQEAETRTNIAAMLDEIRAAGAQPVLLAVPRPAVMAALLGSLDVHPLYEALAEERRVPLFAAGWAKVLSDPSDHRTAVNTCRCRSPGGRRARAATGGQDANTHQDSVQCPHASGARA